MRTKVHCVPEVRCILQEHQSLMLWERQERLNGRYYGAIWPGEPLDIVRSDPDGIIFVLFTGGRYHQ